MYFFELCRLCLVNCGSIGIIVYENDDIRRGKIKECLSIAIADRYQICSNCEGKLECFYQFRLDSLRAQHDFNDIIIKSVHPSQNQQILQYEQPEFYPPIPEQNMYANMYESQADQANEIQDYQGIYIEHDLHDLALGDHDQDQTGGHSLISMPTTTANDQHIYQQMQTPKTEIHEDEQATEIMEETQPEPKLEILNNDNDFTYDDFDESCQSFPNDRNNIDNAIDKKIEEFIQNKRHKANPKICTVCNKLFRTNYKLREHMQTHENNPKFFCDFPECNKTFKSKIGLKEHAAKHTGEYNFVCTDCDKKFLLRSYYLAHQKIHSDVKNFACTMCTKTFKNKHNLTNHENFHYGLKHFMCQICQKSFTTKTNLDVHLKSHTQLEQFECSTCHKFFKTKAYLKVHIKTHYKEMQNYVCTICNKSFIQLCDLKTHAKTHTNQKDFVCEVCGESFTRKDSLRLHVSSVHNKQHTFPCNNCHKTFSRKNTLNQHRKKCIGHVNVMGTCEAIE